ncbi:hypothetical protein HK102_000555 [Quaeritorhiza haematococci]|nr:hypothetical protein HK102_000555 [Quaeritorhiza haematococci]
MRCANSTKIFLLFALVAVLIENGFSSPFTKWAEPKIDNLQSTNDESTSTDPYGYDDTSPPFYGPADTCSPGYDKRNSGCFLAGAEFTFESANGLIHLDLPNHDTISAHHIVFTVFAKLPGSEEKVVVAGVPVEIIPTETKQYVYSFDTATAEVKRARVKANDRFKVVTNAMGRASFSFPIEKDKNLRLQEMLVRVDFMGADEWFAFYADTAAINALSKLTGQHLRAANTNLSPDEAESNAQIIRTLFRAPAENDYRVYLDEVEQTIPLKPSDSETRKTSRRSLSKRANVQDVERDLEQIKVEAIKTVEIVKKGGRKAIKALIRGGKKIIEVIVTTITTAVKVFLQILKMLGLTAKALLHALTTRVRWKDVKATHIQFMSNIYAIRSGMTQANYMLFKGIVNNAFRQKDNFDRMMQNILDHVRELDAQSTTGPTGVNQYTYMADLIVNIGEQVKFKNVDPEAIQKLIDILQNIKQQVIDSNPDINQQHPEIVQSFIKVERNLEAAKKTGLTVKIVNELFKFIRFMHHVVLGTVTVVLAGASTIFWGAVEMAWNCLELGADDVHGPNGEKYGTLLSLLVLPASYLYTYGYMLAHSGTPPYPKPSQAALPSNSQQTNVTPPPPPPPQSKDPNPTAPQLKDPEWQPSVPSIKVVESAPPSAPTLKEVPEPAPFSKESKAHVNPAAAKIEDLLEPGTPSAHSDNLIDLEPDTPSASEGQSNAQGLTHLLDRRSALVRRGTSVSSETMKALVEVSNSFGALRSANENVFAGIGILQFVAVMGRFVEETGEMIGS